MIMSCLAKIEMSSFNIDDTVEAIDSLLSITSADISEIRLMMDVLLGVYLGKLILVFSPWAYISWLSPRDMRTIPKG